MVVVRLLILSVALVACSPETQDTRSISPKSSEPQGISDPDDSLPYISHRQFAVLDPQYDYNPKDPISAQEMARRFPVFSDGKSEIAYLKSGPEFFASRMQLLDQAQKSVRIQSLIFKGDESGFAIMQKLVEVRKKGVSVHVIIDPMSNYSPDDQKIYYYLQRNGITVEGFELLYLSLVDFAQVRNGDEFGLAINQINMRYHEKMFIIDGESPTTAIAITGGTNIGNEYFRNNQEDAKKMWHDRDIIVRGRVAWQMAKVFDANEHEFRTERLNLGSIDIAWALINATFGKPKDLNLELNSVRQERLRAFAAASLPLEWVKADIRFIQSRPRFEEDLIFPAYIDMIESAETEILLANAYFIADDELIAAMSRAINRGVNVKVMTNHVESNDFPQLQKISRTKYKKLLALNSVTGAKGTVSIYEWAGDKVLNNGEGLNHSKYMVVDRKAVIVGSYNIDPRSRNLNTESVIIFEEATEAEKYAQEFDLGTTPAYCVSVTPAEAATYNDPDNLEDRFELELLKIINPLL